MGEGTGVIRRKIIHEAALGSSPPGTDRRNGRSQSLKRVCGSSPARTVFLVDHMVAWSYSTIFTGRETAFTGAERVSRPVCHYRRDLHLRVARDDLRGKRNDLLTWRRSSSECQMGAWSF